MGQQAQVPEAKEGGGPTRGPPLQAHAQAQVVPPRLKEILATLEGIEGNQVRGRLAPLMKGLARSAADAFMKGEYGVLDSQLKKKGFPKLAELAYKMRGCFLSETWRRPSFLDTPEELFKDFRTTGIKAILSIECLIQFS